MIKNKAYKFRFYPTNDQIDQLSKEFGNARFVWNLGLEYRNKAYARRKESLNYISISKFITQLKKSKTWLKDSTANVLIQKLIDQDTAFKNFFEKRSERPNFKKKSNKQSIRYQLDQRTIQNNFKAGEFLKVPKLGLLDIKWSRIPNGIPKMLTITKTPSNEFYVSFSVEEEIIELPKTNRSIGLDLGIKDVIVSSDGYYSGSPKYTSMYSKELRKAQRILSRRTKGSNRWHKQRLIVAKIHRKIANSRLDFIHKLTTMIVREYDLIAIEDLNVVGMMKNRKLSKAIADIGMHELKRQLQYKCDWYGKTLVMIDRFFPSTRKCSNCGTLHKMPLDKRLMECGCGFKICRDLNAAINILHEGASCYNKQVGAI